MPDGFIFDTNRCTGCDACRLACTIENELRPDLSWRCVETFNPRHHPAAPVYHISLACNHCVDPVCMYACPALAYSRDATTRVVLLDDRKCMGCSYCAWACPYDAPVLDRVRGVMTKCTLCAHRLELGLKPACSALCPTGALDFGEVPEAEPPTAVAGFPESNLGPRVRISPLRPERLRPEMTAADVANPVVTAADSRASKISLRSEWPLFAFTSLAAALVALVASSVAGALSIKPVLFVDAAILTLGLGALHLRKVRRAYRAVLNLRRSWLSREVVVVSAFFALATIYLWLAPGLPALGAVATLLGFLGLLCADQVYSVLKDSGPAYRHSASLLWTGFFLTAVFTGRAWLAAIFGFGKLALYILRKLDFGFGGRPVRPMLSAARLGLGLLTPLALWVIAPVGSRGYIIGLVLLGELIDRGEYYDELESESPRRHMAAELEKQVGGQTRASAGLAVAAAD
ncbi:MAG: dimethyl sulfoxide reductase anchor subunit [Gemmatimonadota bacterium]|nr:MAG: dimethyl sulfoxide reductase anchor subunit [Gemmatimonadota bacterium]